MNMFWKLLETSTLTSGMIAIMLVGAVVYLACTGKPIPDYLGSALIAMIAFFFGAKSQKEAQGRVS